MQKSGKFGTAPVFFTAVSTILGAILFLRFGFAVGTLGFWGTILIIMLGHLVTIPTAFAISELATNKRVEGGGEYFIISRSFGLNIGATIGLALYLSQAISVAFYVIAFTEAFEFFFNFMKEQYNIMLPRQVISIPIMTGLSFLIIKKGANSGVKTLYIVVGILFLSLVLFFLGKTDFAGGSSFNLSNAEFRNTDQFFIVFAIIFPAFTGMTAGVGLSGDLKRPSRSIPLGTTIATFTGFIIYFFITYKLAGSASAEDLIGKQLIMGDIALGGAFIIPLGLAASTISSALGSVMVAPRTLQALAKDRSFPSKRLNSWFSFLRDKDQEPVNASVITCVIAMIFVVMGDVNAVAEIISMFFMLTYGSLCLISFLNHFGSSPSYRPSFRSKWVLSLIGFITSFWVMFKINSMYAAVALILMTLIYLYINTYHKDRQGLADIFKNALFQMNRNVQVYLQKSGNTKKGKEWRPSAICITRDSFQRKTAFRLLNWISYKYGFGTYLHLIPGYFSKTSNETATDTLSQLIKDFDEIQNHVYIDTLISPSYTSAIAQAVQLPGISGMENNMLIFEFNKDQTEKLNEIIENFALVRAANFDVCILGSTAKRIQFKGGIHVWIKASDTYNANLMILLSYIILGHPDWKHRQILIFDICKSDEVESTKKAMKELVQSGRLPITEKNITVIPQTPEKSSRSIIEEQSKGAGLVIIGLRSEQLKHDGTSSLKGYEKLGNVLFVNAHEEKIIE